MADLSPDQTASECADHLARIAHQLRQNGDVQLVYMTEEGVGPASITLADELWLIALRLDFERTMAKAKELNERDG